MLGTHLRMFSQILTTPGVQRRLKVSGLNWGLTGLTLTLKWVNIILLLQCKSDWLELSSMSDIFEQINSLPASNGSQPMRMNMLRSDWKLCPARKTIHIKMVWTIFICIVSTDARWREILTHFTRSCQPPNYKHISRTEDVVYKFTLTKLSSCWSENTEEF